MFSFRSHDINLLRLKCLDHTVLIDSELTPTTSQSCFIFETDDGIATGDLSSVRISLCRLLLPIANINCQSSRVQALFNEK